MSGMNALIFAHILELICVNVTWIHFNTSQKPICDSYYKQGMVISV